MKWKTGKRIMDAYNRFVLLSFKLEGEGSVHEGGKRGGGLLEGYLGRVSKDVKVSLLLLYLPSHISLRRKGITN
jgi:hypothetical protein